MNDIISVNYYLQNIRDLGYSIVRQAFIDYKTYLITIKKYKSKEYIKNLEITDDMLEDFKKKKGFSKEKNKKELIELYKYNKIVKIRNAFYEVKEINKFIESEWYTMLCPIIDKRIAREKLREMEKEILGDEVYLLN